MGRRRRSEEGLPSGSGSDFWAAAYGAAASLHTLHGLILTYNFFPTPRKGVWKLQARALEHVDGRPTRVAAQVTTEWPNASAARLEAQAYQLALRLLEELEGDALTRRQ